MYLGEDIRVQVVLSPGLEACTERKKHTFHKVTIHNVYTYTHTCIQDTCIYIYVVPVAVY